MHSVKGFFLLFFLKKLHIILQKDVESKFDYHIDCAINTFYIDNRKWLNWRTVQMTSGVAVYTI